jgi:hypothetical protein
MGLMPFDPQQAMPKPDDVMKYNGIAADVYWRGGELVALVCWRRTSSRPLIGLKPTPDGEGLTSFYLVSNEDVPAFDRHTVHTSATVEVRERGKVPAAVACWDTDDAEPFLALCAAGSPEAGAACCPAPAAESVVASPAGHRAARRAPTDLANVDEFEACDEESVADADEAAAAVTL